MWVSDICIVTLISVFFSLMVSFWLCLILWNCRLSQHYRSNSCLGGAALTFILKIPHKYPKMYILKSHNRGMQIEEVSPVECMATCFWFLCWPNFVRSSGVLPANGWTVSFRMDVFASPRAGEPALGWWAKLLPWSWFWEEPNSASVANFTPFSHLLFHPILLSLHGHSNLLALCF